MATLTPSMRIALGDLKLDRIVVAYPGSRRYMLAPRVEAIPLAQLVGAAGDGDDPFRTQR